MDFDKLQAEVQALIQAATPTKKADEKPSAETRKMTAEQFGAYASEQVEKAKADAQAGRQDAGKRRLTALKAEVDKIAKYAYRDGELPTVTVYKDEEQKDTTEQELQLGDNQPDGQSNWTAKSRAFGQVLESMLKELSAAGGGKPQEPKPGEPKPTDPKPSPEAETEWPDDLAKCIKPSRRDQDADYNWGKDAR